MTRLFGEDVPVERAARRRARSRWLGWVALLPGLMAAAGARGQAPTGPQTLTFAGLRAVNTPQGVPAGQVNGVATDAAGEIYLLVDQKDGVRVLKTDAAAGTVLAQTQLGAAGDVGVALTLDPAGNVYVTGTTTSGALTASAGAAFATSAGSGVNSFVAKFDAALNTQFVTFLGGGAMAASSVAATSDAVFVAGSIYSATLPVTATAAVQAPAYGASGNGFAERFSTNGSTLVYATYLSGAGGSTSAASVVADGSDDAYVGGYTSASGYPTVAALVPVMLGTSSGFVTKLTPAGDGFLFSTFVPGSGVTSLALDTAAGNLLLAGGVSLGQFPVSVVSGPLAPLTYQVLVRMTLDGGAVVSGTALAPGTQSFVTAAGNGVAWVDGSLTLPLLPLGTLSDVGNGFAVRVNAAGAVDQAVRLGGVPANNASYADAPVNLTSVVSDGAGDLLAGGSFQPGSSATLLATQAFDLPLLNAPNAAFPTPVHGALMPVSACNGSLCAGSTGFLERVTPQAGASTASPALALSVDDAPDLTLRNLGSSLATGLQIAVSGFAETDNCGGSLAAGAQCSVALSGSGPGSVTVSAENAAAQTQAIAAIRAGATEGVVFSPKELDFGVASAAGAAVLRTITVSNLSGVSQPFVSAWNVTPRVTFPYTFAEEATDCTLGGGTTRVLAPGGSCHITLSLTPSASAADDGLIESSWTIGARAVQLTAYGQAAGLAVSSSEVDFGTQYLGGIRAPRYLYLSNQTSQSYPHAAVALAAGSPFTVTDTCPGTLAPHSVCALTLNYAAARAPSVDAVTLTLDQGLTVLVTGQTENSQSAAGATVNPNLSLSTNALSFTSPVAVTSVSPTAQTVTVTNNGASPFPVTVTATGDFSETTNCGTLGGGTSCSVSVLFAPSAPGARQGLLSIAAGGGTTPATVTLSGTGIDILTPPSNGAANLGASPVGQPVVTWFKVTQAFPAFAATTGSATPGAPFTAVLVEDIGYGHGSPAASSFRTSVSGTCYNCWLGVQFDPTSIGVETGTLTLASSVAGTPYTLSLTGTGLALTGLLISPASADFGSVAVNSQTSAQLFTVTNLSGTGAAVSLSAPVVTGDFAASSAASGGTLCSGTLAYGSSCVVAVVFAPTATGARNGALTMQGGGSTATSALTGYGNADPGIAFSPVAVVFNNVPGTAATQQTVTVTNTSNASLEVNSPIAATTGGGTSFSVTSNCGTLAVSASCSITVVFLPGTAQVTGTVTVPVTTYVAGSPVLTSYTVALTGAYTFENAGLAMSPAQMSYGPLADGTVGAAQQFQVTNLTGKALSLQVALPRQFVLSGPACAGLAPYASCTFAAAFLPLTNGAITGTLFATGTPSDGTATVNGLAYGEGYGNGGGTLSVTGGLLPGRVLNFGQVPSGQTLVRTLTLTNSSTSATLTVRRLTSVWPFMATSTCGATLQPGASCMVAVTYSPLDQIPVNSNAGPTQTYTGALVIESDAGSSPDTVNLTGTTTPMTVASPSNAAPLASFAASQSSLTFATTQAGDISAPQTVTLNNTGSATIHIAGLQTTPDFTVTSDCAAIVPGTSCSVVVTFTPQPSTQLGPSATRIGAVEISSDALTPLEFVSVIGVSTPAALNAAQSTLDFGGVQVGSKQSLGLQLTNTGTTPVTFGTVSGSGDFSAAVGTCPLPGLTLAAGASCTLQVSFTPTQSGVSTGTLSIASSATTLPLTAALAGVGLQSRLQITPAALSFGAIQVGSSANLSVSLVNAGNSPITGITLTATTGFSVSAPCAVTALAPGASCSATVTFSPAATGPASGLLTVASSDPQSPGTVLLSGTGISGGGFTLTVAGGSIATATVKSGAVARFTLTIAPVNGFNGEVVLNCTPVTPADYAYCSLTPSSVTLNGTTSQSSVAAISTVTSIALVPREQRPGTRGSGRTFGEALLALLFPALLVSGKVRPRRWRGVGWFAWAGAAALALLTASGCGGSGADPNLRYATPGVYQYQVTASSIGTSVQNTQTVTLNVTITR